MLDAIIAGAGPAGSMAALVMARAGARVLVVDRDRFPRDKLCGDTLNPGAVALLHALGLHDGPVDRALPLAGMLVSGPRTRVEARYGHGLAGRAILRRDLDGWLLEQAIRAGARFEAGLVARAPLVDDRSAHPLVRGLRLTRRGAPSEALRMPAAMTIAADGRRSAIARAVGLTSHPRRPRRWAFGTYAEGVADVRDLGEMHIRQDFYFGIAPVSATLANVCVVTGARPAARTPMAVIESAIARDPWLRERFASARFSGEVNVLGPLAVNATAPGVDGLLLAGDAAGFIDPMTGDGLHLAMRGAVLAAHEALRVLESGNVTGAVDRLADARRSELGAKLRFNRVLRAIVASPAAIEVAGLSAAVAPGLLRSVVRYAGDAGPSPASGAA